MMKNYKIAIADPSPIILTGMSVIIKELADYDVVLKTNDVQTLAARLHVVNPDLLIINPVMMD